MNQNKDLISPGYKAANRAIHNQDPMWGDSAPRWLDQVLDHARSLETTSVLDYGSGKGLLKVRGEPLGLQVSEYDPGIKGKDTLPEPAGIVACLDVMEHVEPQFVENVLQHIGELSQKGAILVIALYPSGTILPDGRNAHQTVESPEWWLAKMTHVWKFPMVLESHVQPRPTRNPRGKDVLVVRMKKTEV